ncbi:hypothetical protein [Gorillibacterium massiliense]|uniref:hypothetical protein n=1 Tax=Gorillibacterium massiliense TaxID=1280390 RepID=UPI0004ACB67C|nr:hypothetical protein [Gorillibacterium massiliense]
MATKMYPHQKLKRERNDGKLVATITTVVAWTLLGCGLMLCLFNLNHFNDRNLGLMAGTGFLVASFFIYTIGTSMHLVQVRKPQGKRARLK